MVDFSKELDSTELEIKTSPIDIYTESDRHNSAGQLRDAQSAVLEEWFQNHSNDKDVIIKLHTGEGKTLVGLLMLQSRLNMRKGPCVYVSPNIQLAEQVTDDADKFGIKYVFMGQDDDIPLDFEESRAILITYVHKIFNGKTKFGLNNHGVKVGTFVLDDSHACIDAIRGASTIRIKRESEAFKSLLMLFQQELRGQGEGRFYKIEKNIGSDDPMLIPYWDWVDKSSDVLSILMNNEQDKEIKFALPLLMNDLKKCAAYVTCKGIEIVPDFSLIHRFTSFYNADQRIMMSATTQDDSFFIKGLGLGKKAIETPLTNTVNKWSGEKMILFPSHLDETLYPEVIRDLGASLSKNVNTVSLVPSYLNVSLDYKNKGYTEVTRYNISKVLARLKSKTDKSAVIFANRYDGINLADDMCRMLIIDSLPISNSLPDRYEESCREDSDIIKVKIAQKIEQGLGRNVRSQKDYSVIVIIGADITNFMNSSRYQKFFSSQTKTQINIASRVTQLSKDDIAKGNNPIHTLQDLINKCLNRDAGWKAFYEKKMNELTETPTDHPYLDTFILEYEAEFALANDNLALACSKYRDLVNLALSDSEKGWYLQKLAKFTFLTDRAQSTKIQDSAFAHNHYLLKTDNMGYTRIKLNDDARLKNVLKYLSKYDTYSDLKSDVDKNLSYLTQGVCASKFEQALYEIAKLIGFESQRPDLEFKKGPDNLWSIGGHDYIAIECKNQVAKSRSEIIKSEIGQMSNHKGWFEENYPGASCSYIFVHQTNQIADNANPTFPIKVFTYDMLEKLKNRALSFTRSFCKYEISSITEETVSAELQANKLMPKEIILLAKTVKK